MALQTVTVTAAYRDESGTGYPVGTVEFTLSTPLQDASGNLICVPITRSATLSATGTISIVLVATDTSGAEPEGATYHVVERITGAGLRAYDIEVPAASPGGTLDLADVAPVEATNDGYTYALQSALTTETVARAAADTTLTTNVAALASADVVLGAAVAALDVRVTALETTIDGGTL